MTDEEQAQLRRQHPNWHIRRPGEAPYVMATRQDRTHVTDDELYAGLCMTLIEDTPGQLGDALAHQQKIEAGRTPPPGDDGVSTPAMPDDYHHIGVSSDGGLGAQR